jgi:hypothetical protein
MGVARPRPDTNRARQRPRTRVRRWGRANDHRMRRRGTANEEGTEGDEGDVDTEADISIVEHDCSEKFNQVSIRYAP